MRIALVQQHATDDRNENLQRGLLALEEAAVAGANLVCYAELAFEPFYPQRPVTGDPRSLAQEVPGPVTEAFSERAASLGVVLILNLYERDGERCFDCSPVIDADGSLLGRVRMVHITDYPCFHEQGYYTPGDTVEGSLDAQYTWGEPVAGARVQLVAARMVDKLDTPMGP